MRTGPSRKSQEKIHRLSACRSTSWIRVPMRASTSKLRDIPQGRSLQRGHFKYFVFPGVVFKSSEASLYIPVHVTPKQAASTRDSPCHHKHWRGHLRKAARVLHPSSSEADVASSPGRSRDTYCSACPLTYMALTTGPLGTASSQTPRQVRQW